MVPLRPSPLKVIKVIKVGGLPSLDHPVRVLGDVGGENNGRLGRKHGAFAIPFQEALLWSLGPFHSILLITLLPHCMCLPEVSFPVPTLFSHAPLALGLLDAHTNFSFSVSFIA